MAKVNPQERAEFLNKISKGYQDEKAASSIPFEEGDGQVPDGQARDEKGRFTRVDEDDTTLDDTRYIQRKNTSSSELDDDDHTLNPTPSRRPARDPVEDEDDGEDSDDGFIRASAEEMVSDSFKSKKFKVKVDGSEEEVDLDTMLRSYQKNRAADERLKSASEKEKEASALAERYERLLELQQRTVEDREKTIRSLLEERAAPKNDLPQEDESLELFESLFNGDAAKAKEKLNAIREADRRRVTEQMAQVATEIERKAMQKAQEALETRYWQESVDAFRSKRKDIVEDEALAKLFDSFVAEEWEGSGKKLSPAIIANAEAKIDSFLGRFGKKQEEEQEPARRVDDAMAERERKAAAAMRSSVPSKVAAKQKASKEREPLTGSDAVSAMQKMRQPWKNLI